MATLAILITSLYHFDEHSFNSEQPDNKSLDHPNYPDDHHDHPDHHNIILATILTIQILILTSQRTIKESYVKLFCRLFDEFQIELSVICLSICQSVKGSLNCSRS